jgi:hypothetical protein
VERILPDWFCLPNELPGTPMILVLVSLLVDNSNLWQPRV